MTRHEVLENQLEKGQALWQKIDNAYMEARDSLYAKHRELISKENNGQGGALSIIVNSDGSGLGNKNSPMNTGIVGIGHYLNIFTDKGRVKNTIPRYEYIIAPGTVKEAEIYASLQGVRTAKDEASKLGADRIRLNLVTDSLGVIEMLHQIPIVLKEISNIETKFPNKIPSFISNKYREMKLVRDLANELYNDERVVGVNTRWVRSHMLDDVPYEDLKSVEVYLNHRIKSSKGYAESSEWRDNKRQFHDMKNNKIADEAASKASVKGVEARLNFFVNKLYLKHHNPDIVYQQEIIKTGFDLKNSYEGARQHGIKYMATLKRDALKLNEIEMLFGKGASHEIAKERMKIIEHLQCKADEIPAALKNYFREELKQRMTKRESGRRYDTDFSSMVMNKRLTSAEVSMTSEKSQNHFEISGP